MKAQFLMDVIDTSRTQNENEHISFYKKYDRFRITGYLQPQVQLSSKKGAKSYNGGDFASNSNNRFMLRRGRLRFDYGRFNDKNELVLEFYFQIDGTERGVVTRDFWGRYFENKYKLFAITTGIFARPFGYELNLSSSDRESPERGRMSQILMRTERDIGAMISIEPRKKNHPLRMLKLDFGLFNGQGLPATADYDSFKDFISRLRLKTISIAPNVQLSAGISYLNGGHFQNTKYTYSTILNNNIASVKIDSNETNLGKKSPRVYSGADMQLVFKHKESTTECRAEYW
ncbi:MAG: porin, partial [Chitinophagaceae bacterium]